MRLIEGSAVARRCRQVEIELDGRAHNGAISALTRAVLACGTLERTSTTQAQFALGAAAHVTPEIASAPCTRRSAPAEVVMRALGASVAALVGADAYVQLDQDPAWVHRAHAATRALRSDLRAFAALLDRDAGAALDARLRELAGRLGAVRDDDVLLEHVAALATRLPAADGVAVACMLDLCRTARDEAFAKLAAALRDDAYVSLLDDLVRSVAPESPLVSPAATMRQTRLASDVMAKPWRKLRQVVRTCGDEPTATQLHAVRIRVKRCRYAAEAVAPLVPTGRSAAARRFLRRLKRLQNTLGAFHDAVNETDRLRALTSPALDRFVAGEIAGLEADVAAAARAAWRKAWQRASRRGVRFWQPA